MPNEIRMGNVVHRKGYDEKKVIVGEKNWEDDGACSYARDYQLMDIEKLNQLIEQYKPYAIPKSELEANSSKFELRGMTMTLEVVEDIPGFVFEHQNCFKVRQKVAKTITVYE
jgi:hypothetical protein